MSCGVELLWRNGVASSSGVTAAIFFVAMRRLPTIRRKRYEGPLLRRFMSRNSGNAMITTPIFYVNGTNC